MDQVWEGESLLGSGGYGVKVQALDCDDHSIGAFSLVLCAKVHVLDHARKDVKGTQVQVQMQLHC